MSGASKCSKLTKCCRGQRACRRQLESVTFASNGKETSSISQISGDSVLQAIRETVEAGQKESIVLALKICEPFFGRHTSVHGSPPRAENKTGLHLSVGAWPGRLVSLLRFVPSQLGFGSARSNTTSMQLGRLQVARNPPHRAGFEREQWAASICDLRLAARNAPASLAGSRGAARATQTVEGLPTALPS